jgi:hypothetical protein
MVKRAFSGAYFWCLFGVCFYKNRQKETNVRKVEISKNRMIPPFIALYKCVQKSFWRIHNYIRKDTYTETAYQDEKAALQLKDNKVYFLPSTDCQRAVDDSLTQNRLDKNRLDKNSIDICAEQFHSSTPEIEESPVISLVLNDKSNFPVYQKQVNEWEELYPAVNVMQELRKMSGWLNSNPKKRKTKSGILRFINSWLSREQDSGGSKQAELNQNSAFKLSGDYESL